MSELKLRPTKREAGAWRRLFTRRGGLAYAAPPFDAAAGCASGQDGAGGLAECRSRGGVYGNEVIWSEGQTVND
jgi:hypothetical protein